MSVGIKFHPRNKGWVSARSFFPEEFVGRKFICVEGFEGAAGVRLYKRGHVYTLEYINRRVKARCPIHGDWKGLNCGWFMEVDTPQTYEDLI